MGTRISSLISQCALVLVEGQLKVSTSVRFRSTAVVKQLCSAGGDGLLSEQRRIQAMGEERIVSQKRFAT